MRAREYIVESSDTRSVAQKLLDLINHPNTEDTVKAVAKKKYDELLKANPSLATDETAHERPVPDPDPQTFTIATNVEYKHFGVRFGSETVGELYKKLGELSIKPRSILFHRSGQIILHIVSDRYETTLSEFCNEIKSKFVDVVTVKGSRGLSGYDFNIRFGRY